MFTPRRHEQQYQPEKTAAYDQAGTGNGGSTGYMAELDEWLDFTIFEPIENAIAGGDAKSLHIAFIESKQALKASK